MNIVISALLIFVASTAAKPAALKVAVVSKPAECTKTSNNGDVLAVHYKGFFEDGQLFDSSRDSSRPPFTFQLGVGQVIKGWDEGLRGMCVGETRRLVVPPHLGYGTKGAGSAVPSGTTLIFEVELLNMEQAAPAVNLFKKIDLNSDKKLSREEVKKYFKSIQDYDKLVSEVFQMEDHDGNGFISHDEFTGPKE